jgi:cytochrome c5
MTTVAGAPVDGKHAERVDVMMSELPNVLSGIHGDIAIGTKNGVMAASLSDASVMDVPAVDQEGAYVTVGAVHRIARRADGGVLVVADGGLFTDQDGILMRSPLTDVVRPMGLVAVDAFGSATDEELWIVNAEGLLHDGGGMLEGIAIPNAPKPEAVVGVAPGRAIMIGAGEAWLVDVTAKTAKKITSGLGVVHGSDRSDDRTAFFATDGGLFSFSSSGAATLRTLAADGAPATSVLGVTAAYGSVLAVTATSLVSVTDKEASIVGTVATPQALSIATDGDGDAWLVDGAGVGRFKTGAPVSFATDVAPFMKAHCTACHKDGTNGAPPHDFTTYDESKKLGGSIAKKLRAPEGMGEMPPVATEKLAASDYAAVTRWVAGGMLP